MTRYYEHAKARTENECIKLVLSMVSNKEKDMKLRKLFNNTECNNIFEVY